MMYDKDLELEKRAVAERSKELDRREADIKTREKGLKAAEKKLKARERECGTKEAVLAQKMERRQIENTTYELVSAEYVEDARIPWGEMVVPVKDGTRLVDTYMRPSYAIKVSVITPYSIDEPFVGVCNDVRDYFADHGYVHYTDSNAFYHKICTLLEKELGCGPVIALINRKAGRIFYGVPVANQNRTHTRKILESDPACELVKNILGSSIPGIFSDQWIDFLNAGCDLSDVNNSDNRKNYEFVKHAGWPDQKVIDAALDYDNNRIYYLVGAPLYTSQQAAAAWRSLRGYANLRITANFARRRFEASFYMPTTPYSPWAQKTERADPLPLELP